MEPIDYQILISGFSAYYSSRTYDKGFLDFITSNVDLTAQNNAKLMGMIKHLGLSRYSSDVFYQRFNQEIISRYEELEHQINDELLYTYSFRQYAILGQKQEFYELKEVMRGGLSKIKGVQNTLNCIHAIVMMQDF